MALSGWMEGEWLGSYRSRRPCSLRCRGKSRSDKCRARCRDPCSEAGLYRWSLSAAEPRVVTGHLGIANVDDLPAAAGIGRKLSLVACVLRIHVKFTEINRAISCHIGIKREGITHGVRAIYAEGYERLSINRNLCSSGARIAVVGPNPIGNDVVPVPGAARVHLDQPMACLRRRGADG